jgi:hypothetical protein
MKVVSAVNKRKKHVNTPRHPRTPEAKRTTLSNKYRPSEVSQVAPSSGQVSILRQRPVIVSMIQLQDGVRKDAQSQPKMRNRLTPMFFAPPTRFLPTSRGTVISSDRTRPPKTQKPTLYKKSALNHQSYIDNWKWLDTPNRARQLLRFGR